MLDNPQFSGSFVALVTPMHSDGSVDWDCLKKLIDWHVEAKTVGIVSVGTTGESPTIDMDEHNEVIATTIKYAAQRLAVIAGTGANSTLEAIRLTEQACADGADACLSVVPYYNKPSQAGLVCHFTAIADSSTKPIILYNVPSRTITDLADKTLVELAKHPRIVGIKDATGNISRLKWQQQHIKKDFCWLSGDDATCKEYVVSGGHGVISVSANVAPTMMHDLIVAAQHKDQRRADEIDTKLAAFNRLQSIESNPIPVKWSLCKLGRINSGIRLPLTPLASKHHVAVQNATKDLH